MDKDTRNLIQRATQKARRLLEEEYSQQLEGTYDIRESSGEIAEQPNATLDGKGRHVREQIVAAIQHERAKVRSNQEAIAAFLRECTFTTLNRFAGLKLMEARQIVRQCISKGDQSSGYKEFCGLAPGILELSDGGYRLYLECLFDEVGTEVGVLFDRLHPSSLLWPRRPVLLELLEILNQEGLSSIWQEDETIGWIYQYFNDEAERKQMREESAAPRNSRELAVRNQFFTPRYVVEFLTDNTLGRIWYEMTKGKTRLKERCRYLVRRPNEFFLALEREDLTPWVKDVILTADFSKLPENPAIQELFDFAHGINGYEEIERRGFATQEYVDKEYNPRAEARDKTGETWTGDAGVLWTCLFLHARLVLRSSQTDFSLSISDYSPLRELWPGLRNALQNQKTDATQEELLRQPHFIPFRPLKDPREILMLDPACGSMHFGLYAFDLFEIIYAEAFEDVGQGDLNNATLRNDFSADSSALQKEVPRLIIEKNIHGIDIDPRAAQIAGLSLWLRAQRSWQVAGVPVAERPKIQKSNVVCAAPMPGEREMLQEFIRNQFPAAEQPAFKFLLERIFDRMKLAGEAGSLLKIEEEIVSAISDAKKLWKQGPRQEQTVLFAPPNERLHQRELNLDLSGITDAEFWVQAEEKIYQALKLYSEQAESALRLRRRLFSADTAQGFAFIDICRKRFDFVLMNPPFGELSKFSKTYAEKAHPDSKGNILAHFIDRLKGLTDPNGKSAAIVSRACFFLISLSNFRISLLGDGLSVEFFADLGDRVLDAMVETAGVIFSRRPPAAAIFSRILTTDQKAIVLEERCKLLGSGTLSESCFIISTKSFNKLKGSPYVYWITVDVIDILSRFPLLEEYSEIRVGLQTGDDERFLRLWTEIDPKALIQSESDVGTWAWYSKTDEASAFAASIHLVVNWMDKGLEIKASHVARGDSSSRYVMSESTYFRPGISYMLRSFRLIPYIVPRSVIPTAGRSQVFPRQGKETWVLALLASNLASSVARFRGEMFLRPKFQNSMVCCVPYVEPCEELDSLLKQQISLEVNNLRRFLSTCEECIEFSSPSTKTETGKYRINRSSLLGRKFDLLIASAYGLSERQLTVLERDLLESIPQSDSPREHDGDCDPTEINHTSNSEGRYASLASYWIGVVFGRWDLRVALEDQQNTETVDPFAPLPACPRGMLQGTDGLPLSTGEGRKLRAEGEYPLDVVWGGIVVDDPEHSLDIIKHVRAVLQVFWKNRAEAIETEACEILGIKSLREWFSNPNGFFADHLKRYSKSRRQAPIYWPFSTPSGSYTVWVYHHRFTPDTFYRIRELVDDKLRHEERQFLNAKEEAGENPNTRQAKELAQRQKFLEELKAFQAEIIRVAPLWNPNLNDGVIINFAPFHRLIAHTKWRKDVTACWETLVSGEYDWAHLALHLWPERVIPKCATDRSLAIAHGLDEVLWEPDPAREGKYRPKTVEKHELAQLIASRTNPAVKAALNSTSAVPSTNPRRRRK